MRTMIATVIVACFLGSWTTVKSAEPSPTAKLLAVAENRDELKGVSPSATMVVMFSAHWCHPCQRDEPFVRAMAERYGWAFVYINTDDETTRGVRRQWDIMYMPTYITFSKGEVVENFRFGSTKVDETGDETRARINARFAKTAKLIPK